MRPSILYVFEGRSEILTGLWCGQSFEYSHSNDTCNNRMILTTYNNVVSGVFCMKKGNKPINWISNSWWIKFTEVFLTVILKFCLSKTKHCVQTYGTF